MKTAGERRHRRRDKSHTDRLFRGSDRVSRVVAAVVLSVVAAYGIIPLIWLVISSTKTNPQFFGTLPFDILPGFAGQWVENLVGTLQHEQGIYLDWIRNSIIYSVGGSLGATLLAAAAGYAIGKFEFPGRRAVMIFIYAGILLPATILTVPLYLMFVNIGFSNTIWSVLLPALVSPLGVFLSTIYVRSAVPDAILDSARIDGAGELRIFFQIVIPQITPALTTVFLFQFVAIWNNYFLPLMMLRDRRLYPLTVGIADWNSIAVTFAPTTFPYILLGTLLAVVPIIVVFIALQRFWRKGLAAGSVTS